MITFPVVCLGVCQLPVMEPSTGERVSNLEELPLSEFRDYIKVQTDKGTEVATNLVIMCNGIKINSSAYHSAFGEWVAQEELHPSCLLSLQHPETHHSPSHLNQHPVSSCPIDLELLSSGERPCLLSLEARIFQG